MSTDASRAAKIIHALGVECDTLRRELAEARASLAAPPAPAQPAVPVQAAHDWLGITRSLIWSPAPARTEWGYGMVCCDVALTKDSTLTLYAHQDDIK